MCALMPRQGGSSQKTKKTRRAPRGFAKSAATKRRVMEAAARVLLDRGYAATRLGDIADVAELQAGSLYYYFESKEELVEEVLRYGVQFVHTHVRAAVEALPDDATPREKLDTAVDAQLECLLNLGDMAPAHVRSYSQLPPEMKDQLRPLRRSFGDYWGTLVEEAVAAGVIRDDIDPILLRRFIISTLDIVFDWPTPGRRAAGDIQDLMRTLILQGIGADAAKPSIAKPRAGKPRAAKARAKR